jgi:hypothetical protein
MSENNMIKLEIDRSKWACGKNNAKRGQNSALLDENGFKCCLGFLGSACGLTDKELLHHATPGGAPSEKWPKGLLTADPYSSDILHPLNSTLARTLMNANDDKRRVSNEVEQEIADRLKEIGVEVMFVGEYLP